MASHSGIAQSSVTRVSLCSCVSSSEMDILGFLCSSGSSWLSAVSVSVVLREQGCGHGAEVGAHPWQGERDALNRGLFLPCVPHALRKLKNLCSCRVWSAVCLSGTDPLGFSSVKQIGLTCPGVEWEQRLESFFHTSSPFRSLLTALCCL